VIQDVEMRPADRYGARAVIAGASEGIGEILAHRLAGADIDLVLLARSEARHVDVFAHIVVAVINEVALMLARTDDRTEALATAESAVNEFLDRLLGEQG
jgi:short-subunit dehydrogenase